MKGGRRVCDVGVAIVVAVVFAVVAVGRSGQSTSHRDSPLGRVVFAWPHPARHRLKSFIGHQCAALCGHDSHLSFNRNHWFDAGDLVDSAAAGLAALSQAL